MLKEFNVISKLCTQCRKDVALSDFYKTMHSPDGRKAECKECYKKRATKYYKKKETKKTFTSLRNMLSDFKGATITHKGKLVMKDGKVIDQEWWKGIVITSMLRRNSRIKGEEVEC